MVVPRSRPPPTHQTHQTHNRTRTQTHTLAPPPSSVPTDEGGWLKVAPHLTTALLHSTPLLHVPIKHGTLCLRRGGRRAVRVAATAASTACRAACAASVGAAVIVRRRPTQDKNTLRCEFGCARSSARRREVGAAVIQGVWTTSFLFVLEAPGEPISAAAGGPEMMRRSVCGAPLWGPR